MKIKFPLADARSLALELMTPTGHNLGAACSQWDIAGSIRRKKALVGDIEIIFVPRWRVVPPAQLEFGMGLSSPAVTVSEMDERLDELMREGILEKRKSITGTTMCGPDVKLLVHVPTGIPVDFFACSSAGWTTTLVSRTGGKDSNTELAWRANRLGFTWNPGGVGFTRWVDKKEFPITSEEEAFRFVGMPYPRIRSVHLNRWERPRRATAWTKYGMVKVVWKDVAGNRCWFSSGSGETKREAVSAIEHIEQMCQSVR